MEGTHIPRRGDAIEAWIRNYRNVYGPPFTSDLDEIRWYAIDMLLVDYCDHADTRMPIDQDTSESGW